MNLNDHKIGILGGGQLGKMLCVAAAPWHLDISVLDKDPSYPAAPFCTRFVPGDFSNYADVIAFGKDKDVLTVEIETVNGDALEELQEQGIRVHPDPSALRTIKDKGLQARFYRENGFPYPSFDFFEDAKSIRSALATNKLKYPFVQKSRTEGYDGRGVYIAKNRSTEKELLDTASICMDLIDIHKEVAVIAARNENGEVRTFAPVEMVFHQGANLLDYLQCPAELEERYNSRLDELARELIHAFGICGLLAIEFFIDTSGEIWINEVAPRPHNSGHHTIETCETSQYEQHLRAIMNLPLGNTNMRAAAVMVNLLGPKVGNGRARLEGIENVMMNDGVHLHWYGKTQSKPFRKMGHLTLVGEDPGQLRKKAFRLQEKVKVSI